MRCPECRYPNLQVKDSRKQPNHVWRIRRCPKCGFKGTTYERWKLDEESHDIEERLTRLEELLSD